MKPMRQFDNTEVFTPNADINARFHQLISKFSARSQRRIVSTLRSLKSAAVAHPQTAVRVQLFHMLAELELGARLHDTGFGLEYGHRIDGATPDWFDLTARLLIDVVTAGPTADVCTAMDNGKVACYFGEQDTVSISENRLYTAITNKVSTYRKLVERNQLSYVIGAFGSFENDADPRDGRNAIARWHMFDNRPHVSGVLYFQFVPASFDYIANPQADRPIDLSAANLNPWGLAKDSNG